MKNSPMPEKSRPLELSIKPRPVAATEDKPNSEVARSARVVVVTGY